MLLVLGHCLRVSILTWLGVQKHALLVSIKAETKHVIDTCHVFLQVVELLHLLKLLYCQLLNVDWLERIDVLLIVDTLDLAVYVLGLVLGA